jgi:hypothetical protein
MTGYEVVGLTKLRRCGCERVEERKYKYSYSNSQEYIHDEEIPER